MVRNIRQFLLFSSINGVAAMAASKYHYLVFVMISSVFNSSIMSFTLGYFFNEI
jgi:hypothetical protein